MLARLAWRNAFRHKRRTIITAIAIAAGIMIMISFDTMFAGMDNQTANNVLATDNAALVLMLSGAFEDRNLHPLDNLIENASALSEQLVGENDEVIAAAPRLRFNLFASYGQARFTAVGIGIDPAVENDIFSLDKMLTSGSFLSVEGGLVIGTGLASELGVAPGDVIMIETVSSRGVRDVRETEISGIVSTGNMLADRNYLFITLKDAQNMLQVPGSASEINLVTAGDPLDMQNLELTKESLVSKTNSGLDIYTWKELNLTMFEISSQRRSIGLMIGIIVAIIAMVGIVNTMLLSVFERVRELGTMRAMGFSKSKIRKMLLVEGALIGFVGSLLGVILGSAASLYLVKVGIDFTSLASGFDFPFPMNLHIVGSFSPSFAIAVFLAGWLVSILVTLIPARKATKVEPSQALSHV